MKYSVKNRLFLLKRDILERWRQERKGLLLGYAILLCGVALGVYIGVKIGAKNPPFGVFAKLFHMEFSPFSYLGYDFLRFLLFCIFASLCFVLPVPLVYPGLALFFFGKYFGEVVCVCFQSDAFVAAMLSAVVIHLPSALLGGTLVLLIAQRAKRYRLSNGADLCIRRIKIEVFFFLKIVLAYFSFLFLLYVVFCGALYFLVIAL